MGHKFSNALFANKSLIAFLIVALKEKYGSPKQSMLLGWYMRQRSIRKQEKNNGNNQP